MTQREQAKAAFEADQYHPHCPRCGCGALWKSKLLNRGDGNLWRLYACMQAACAEKFAATIEG